MSSVRIIGGTSRSRKILVPNRVRPTTDRIRESLFNRLGQDLNGKRCLDLFSGTGVLGLEALSRNATHVTFVERSASVLTRIRKSANTFHVKPDNVRFDCSDVHRWLAAKRNGKFDIVFVDPPYSHMKDEGGWQRLLTLIAFVCGDRNSVVYCEWCSDFNPSAYGWSTLHTEKSGGVHWKLLSPQDPGKAA